MGIWGAPLSRPKGNPGINRVPLFGFKGIRREPKPPNYFTSNIPTLRGLGTSGSLWGWALQGVSGVGHSREVSGVGHFRSLWGWALQGVSGLGISGSLGNPGVSGFAHSRRLGTPGSLWGWGWALQLESLGEEFRARRRVEFKIEQPHTEGGEKRKQGPTPGPI